MAVWDTSAEPALTLWLRLNAHFTPRSVRPRGGWLIAVSAAGYGVRRTLVSSSASRKCVGSRDGHSVARKTMKSDAHTGGPVFFRASRQMA